MRFVWSVRQSPKIVHLMHPSWDGALCSKLNTPASWNRRTALQMPSTGRPCHLCQNVNPLAFLGIELAENTTQEGAGS